ncbi:MAG: NAD-dependent epimerase/dehydratase family protein [Bacteroidota bacterium]
MKKALLTGATGMVGSQVLAVLMEEPSVASILSIGRRKTGRSHPKLREIVHDDFLNYTAVEEKLKDLDICIYCLATYQNQVSKEQYVEITCDYQKALTDVLEKVNPGITFVLFGAAGADPSEKSRISFARIKGRAETLLHQTPLTRKYIFRPGYIHPIGEIKPPGIMASVSRTIGGVVLQIAPALGLTNRELAEAMVKVSLDYPEHTKTFENKEIKALCSK